MEVPDLESAPGPVKGVIRVAPGTVGAALRPSASVTDTRAGSWRPVVSVTRMVRRPTGSR
jgi:hypothetical protein